MAHSQHSNCEVHAAVSSLAHFVSLHPLPHSPPYHTSFSLQTKQLPLLNPKWTLIPLSTYCHFSHPHIVNSAEQYSKIYHHFPAQNTRSFVIHQLLNHNDALCALSTTTKPMRHCCHSFPSCYLCRVQNPRTTPSIFINCK